MRIFEKLLKKQNIKNNNIVINEELTDGINFDNDKIYIEKKINIDTPKEPIEKVEETTKYTLPSIEILKNLKLKENLINLPKSSGVIVPIGKNDFNEVQYYDITKMPNLLIGGTVMSGKTNFINNIICSIIMCYSPKDVKIAICDSKGIEYTCYNGIPNLLVPVIKNANTLKILLDYVIIEIQKRYEIFNNRGIKKILDYNKINESEKMPYDIIFIDDYTVFANNIDLNEFIEYIAKNGWNVGIHLIIVANHPTVNVLSALSLLNFPSRLSFRVPSNKDSRMILDTSGAEKITGIGNALLNTPLKGNIEKIFIDLINDEDILTIVNNLKENNSTSYINFLNNDKKCSAVDDYDEPLYDEIVRYAKQVGKISPSLIQRKFRFGYNRAARVIDLLEKRGIVGPANGSKPRDVLIKNIQE